MESAQLLDILGNENRRKILQLLSSRPYYVSEISERLGLGPKAVLQHLGLLEQTGMISGKKTEQRRKYYAITENLKLEVFVSPHSYTVETTAVVQHPPKGQAPSPADDSRPIADLKQLNRQLFELESKRRQLARAQRDIEGEMTDTLSRCIDRVYEISQNNLESEIMLTILKKPQDRRSLSMSLGLPEYFLEEAIQSLIDRKIMNEARQGSRKLLSLI